MVYLDPFLPFEACLNGKINNKMYIYLVQITKNQWQWQRSKRKKKSRNQSKNGEMKMNWINELSDSACLDNWTEKQHWTDGNWWMWLDVVAIQLHKNYVYSFDNKHTDQQKKTRRHKKGSEYTTCTLTMQNTIIRVHLVKCIEFFHSGLFEPPARHE